MVGTALKINRISGVPVPDTPSYCSRYPVELFLLPRAPVPDTRRPIKIARVIHRLLRHRFC